MEIPNIDIYASLQCSFKCIGEALPPACQQWRTQWQDLVTSSLWSRWEMICSFRWLKFAYWMLMNTWIEQWRYLSGSSLRSQWKMICSLCLWMPGLNNRDIVQDPAESYSCCTSHSFHFPVRPIKDKDTKSLWSCRSCCCWWPFLSPQGTPSAHCKKMSWWGCGENGFH